MRGTQEGSPFGRVFDGAAGIGEYFESYFVGYETHTRLVRVDDEGDHLHVEVEFTGSFPGGRTRGVFDLTVVGAKLAHVRADLV